MTTRPLRAPLLTTLLLGSAACAPATPQAHDAPPPPTASIALPSPPAPPQEDAPPAPTSSAGWPAPEVDAPSGPQSELDSEERVGATHIASLYRGRLAAFLRRGLTLPSLGLPPEQAKALRATAQCRFGDGMIVIECVLTRPSGNAALDAAVVAHLRTKKGTPAPPPPEDRAELGLETASVVISCAAGGCE